MESSKQERTRDHNNLILTHDVRSLVKDGDVSIWDIARTQKAKEYFIQSTLIINPIEPIRECFWVHTDSPEHVLYRQRPHYLKTPNLRWDGYAGESNVIIYPIDLCHKKLLKDLIIWCSNFYFIAKSNVCSRFSIQLERVIIVSHYIPEQIWRDSSSDRNLDRLLSRINVIRLKNI